MIKKEVHELAKLIPEMSGDEYRELVKDIAANGLIEPITLYEDKILDGRHRYKACMEIGLVPEYDEYTGTDAVQYVISKNLHRRHLNSSQLAVVALNTLPYLEAKAKERQGARNDLNIVEFIPQSEHKNLVVEFIPQQKDATRARKEAAVMVGTNARYVSDAKKIQQEAPEFLPRISSGEMTIPQAKREIVKAQRSETPELPNDKYRVVYADPPWSYGNSGAGIDNYGPAERHYTSMSIEELCDLPIKEMVEDNAVLFLWVTSPLLEECFPVIKAWGFKYKTSFVWDKVKHNFGHYNSVRHELLLVCTRGSCTPDVPQLFDSVQSIERSEKHSEKPEEFRNIIDTLYTRGKRIELFARATAENWRGWGNEPGVH